LAHPPLDRIQLQLGWMKVEEHGMCSLQTEIKNVKCYALKLKNTLSSLYKGI